MSGETALDQINEARRVVEELGGKKTNDLNELRSELDRMIADSKKPGYQQNRETLLKKRELVISAMETALHIVMNDTVDNARTETPAETVTSTTAPTQSAFVPESTTPASTPAPAEEPKNAWQKFVKGAGTFFSSVGTMFSNLWNKWFGKKENAPTSDVQTETQVAAATTTTTPETTTTTAAETPSSTIPETTTPITPVTAHPTVPETTTVTAPETTTTAETTTPAAAAEAPQTVESVSLMDGAAHDIAGHQFLWTGQASNLFSLDGKKFGLSTTTHLFLNGALQSIGKKDNSIVIETNVGRMELDEMQIASLMDQTMNGTPRTERKLFGGTYQSLPVTITYTSVAADGTRTLGSRDLELLPQ